MQDKCILRDCAETLKHAAMLLQQVATESDSDGLRKTLMNVMIDKQELSNAVFNLMHQMGDCQNEPADSQELSDRRQAWRQVYAAMQQGQQRESPAREGTTEQLRR